MRRNYPMMSDWIFLKEGFGEEIVQLPHTWNAADGQDGGNDYYRGTCEYRKEFERPEFDEKTEEVWIEFQGVASSAEVYLNGVFVGRHDGGYSTFRFPVSQFLKETNCLSVLADNAPNRRVYPQKADFTFYGGIYREVRMIIVPKIHFDLAYYGSSGIKVTPNVSDSLERAEVHVETWVTGDTSVYLELDGQKKVVESKNGYAEAVFEIENPHLWNGKEDPYLYELKASLESTDEVTVTFGCRKIAFDSRKGFILNHVPVRLCGVARHQDRQGVGNALTRQDHEEDLKIILEMGANSIRLAHYQHDQYFYELCDKEGMAVWAEIPYITEHMQEANENSLSQMKELIVQNYHHPSVICWGLSNEITATGGVSEELIEQHKTLNRLCHQMDESRPTTMANVFMLNMDHPLVMLPDIRSYNLYYGWYVGDYEQNDKWFDEFHEKYPEAVIGLSEYGADANPQYQRENPEKGDWSEGYQALYHEHMLKMWAERPYIWAMHCWNGFDFGADGRDEGGKPGQNQKGLVTFDRKIKKDAFYIYKAYLSREPFVHICGRRFVDRTEEKTRIKVYSNQETVTLFVDGKEYETQSSDKVFEFFVEISGEHTIEAVSGEVYDKIFLKKVSEPNPAYIKAGTEVVNWFDREDEIVKDGYFSIKDSMGEIKKIREANAVISTLLEPLQKKAAEAYGDVAKNIEIPKEMQELMDRMSVESMLRQMGDLVTPEFVHRLNYELNKVKKIHREAQHA